jgi:hypothetical protein
MNIANGTLVSRRSTGGKGGGRSGNLSLALDKMQDLEIGTNAAGGSAYSGLTFFNHDNHNIKVTQFTLFS